jgi:hypothetical protein
MGYSTGHGDTLFSVKECMKSVFSALPSSSLIRSLSLRVDDRRELDPGADFCESRYRDLLLCIYEQLSSAEKLPHLTSSNILVDVSDDNFAEPVQIRETIYTRAASLRTVSLLRVNFSKAEHLSSLVTPQMG